MRRLALPLLIPLGAAGLLGAWLGLAILDPRSVGWLLDGNDHGQNSLGLIAYLRAAPPWPSLHDPLLMAPEGLSVALTDSNPLLALLLRPFAGWLLPPGWQYAGWWLLACLILQLGFAWALVRPFARDPLAAAAATVLLAATPVLFARYGHINLCAQWLILWALWLFTGEERTRRPLAWCAVLAVAGLVHPYLLVMVAAIWASAQFRLLVIDDEDRLRTLGGALLGGWVIVGVPALIGFLAEPLASTRTYGQFGMAIDALWNAGNGGYSALLPAAASSAAQGFEGMNYLGAGLLALVVAAVAGQAIRRSAEPGRDTPSLRPLLWLVPAFTLLSLVAIGPHLIWRGQIVAAIALPDAVTDALDPLRASGRMFWPAYYAIVFAAVAAACRLPAARVLLLAALLLQTLDLAPMLAVTRQVDAAARARPMFDRTPSTRWDMLVAQAADIEFHPYEAYRDLAVIEQVAWRAVRGCVPMRYFYASREPRSIRERMERDAALLEAGGVDPTRLYVFLKSAPPAAAMARAELLDGIWIIPPAAAAPPPRGCR